MSWVQLDGETWPVSDDDARLHVYVRAPDVGCPRTVWDLDVSHYLKAKNPGPDHPGMERWLDIELGNFTLSERDWRRLSGLEIRGDSAWHAAQEYSNEYGRLTPPRVTVHRTILKPYAEATGAEAGRTGWIAHDFILRLGEREGLCFPCELDAWLILEDEYYRTTPETPEGAARFAEGPPNFRLITRAIFSGGSVDVPRCNDPLPLAQRILLEQTGCDTMLRPVINWMLRQKIDSDESERMPGWRSTVQFFTVPEE